MSTKPLRAAVPKSLLSYLNSFESDRNTYVPDPTDDRRIIVANQKIFNASGEFLKKRPLKVGDKIKVVPEDRSCKRSEEERERDGEEFTIIGVSIWRPGLVLVQGRNLHTVEKDHDWEAASRKINFRHVATNCVTTTSPDGSQAHDPTRTSDGSSRKKSGLLGNDDVDIVMDSSIPLTEYWLGKAAEHNSEHRDAPIVAILDTGIDFQFDWTMCAFPEPACPLWFNDKDTTKNEDGTGPFQKDLIGWNFVGTGSMLGSTQHNNPFDDDENHKHGTRIAAILAHQCRQNKRAQLSDSALDKNVRLMILKTHDYRGVGLLFDIFCAFDYILSRKDVNIINASWGFYGEKIEEFNRYMDKFEDEGIWFINAAGNNNDFDDNYRVHKLSINGDTERYPACYSNSSNKVLTVTTASNLYSYDSCKCAPYYEIKQSENYSKDFVDIAVAAGRDGSFPEPLNRTSHVIRGTSYATAYVIGKLVRSGLMESKTEFLNPANPFILWDNDLKPYVKNGLFLASDVDVEKEDF